MAKASNFTEWGFAPPDVPDEGESRRRRSPFTVVDERGREITAAEAVDDDGDGALRPPRKPLPWGLISLGLLAAAGAIAALAAAWGRPPTLASTPALEMVPPSDEPSEIWTQETVSFDALARARAALEPAEEESSSPVPGAFEAAPSSTADDAKLEPGISAPLETNQAEDQVESVDPAAPHPSDSEAAPDSSESAGPAGDNPY
jgi:hypothetical protein